MNPSGRRGGHRGQHQLPHPDRHAGCQYFGRRATSKQLDRTLAEQRARTLNERFATAAGQLGDDKPPAVRLAGVYAMAGLAEALS